ncbi:putative LPS assembly protein LptD [Amniculibacterium aquaticum]|uniref:putative LPS assembly protein LptD n=1 Tax=Amniculibacterium aquaticum TaxID=2479858 RepID=UPI000F5A1B85|nr:putative LPS assembly protein LptD [Amniculibacterium aquaticum]
MFSNCSKNILHILIILIFNNFLAQQKSDKLLAVKKNQDTVSPTTTTQKEALDDVVRYKAESIRNDLPKKMTYLKHKAQVKYQDMQVDADYISIDWDKGVIFAQGKLDSLEKVLEPVVTLQGGKKYETDHFNFNYKTKRAIAFNARTEESEGVIVAKKTKKYNDTVFFMKNGVFTTDEYFIKKKDSLPDYHMLASSIKLVKGKNKSQIITGPIQLFVEGVPTRLILPFAVLPFSDNRSAGILIPSFGERQDVGFFLNGLGYYQPLGEHFDLKILSDIYTKGSWNIRPEVNYVKKYKYSGSFQSDFGTTIRGINGLDNYSKNRTFRVSWRHSQDPKANPFLNFSASVDIVSSKFYNNTINNNYIFNQNVLNAQQNSTISLTKRFLTLPLTITGTAGYSQNFSTGFSDIRLPQMNVAINQFYLFNPKSGIRQGLLENITVNTGFDFNNYVSVTEDQLFKKEMWDNMQTGLKNSIALGTNTTIAKYFTFSLGANINNGLTTKSLNRSYNPIENKVVDEMNKGIAGFSYFSASTSVQTTLYKTVMFKKGSAIQGIRHMMTPQISFNYSPDFGKPEFGYYKNYYDATGVLTPYSIFEKGIIGTPTTGMMGSVGFSLGNNIEMKVRSKSDSVGFKKLKIFETLNISGNYNFAAKSHRWSPFNINGQTSLFNGKMNINTGLVIDPYEVVFTEGSDVGVRTENFGHFHIQGFNMQLSYPLSDELFGKKEDYSKKYSSKGRIRNENYYFDDDHYAHFDQPWTLNVTANYAYSKTTNRFGNTIATIGLDGNIKLTPYWNVTATTNYDFVTKELAYTRIGFARDQRSFTINFNWVPFGQYKVYDFFIGIKANILKDAVKYKDRSFNQPNAKF